MLAGRCLELFAKKLRAESLAAPFVAAINLGAAGLDALDPELRSCAPGTLIANYHVVADA
jgi:hypothetical protein